MAVVKRLSKVARELNVGISTIVEFLASQGKEVSSNPNTKIGEDLYMILLEEYQKEKFEKEKADNVVIDQPERKVISIKKEEPKKEVEKIIAKQMKKPADAKRILGSQIVFEEVELAEKGTAYPATIDTLRMIVKDKQNQVVMFDKGQALSLIHI